MDKKQFQERVKKLKEINKVIESLDPSIKEASFKLLQSYVTGEEKELSNGGDGETPTDIDRETFFTKFSHDKPGRNVLLITAYLYSQYGTSPVSLKEIKKIADDVGITVPDRTDMTLRQAKKDGKSMFNYGGNDNIRPTVHGEKYFKDTYKVSKGKKKRAKE